MALFDKSRPVSGPYNNVAILYRFRDITTYTEYVTSYDLKLTSPLISIQHLKLQVTLAFRFSCKRL